MWPAVVLRFADGPHHPTQLANDPRDKLAAALRWYCGKFKGADHERVPVYYDMLVEWHERLTASDQELVLTPADVAGSAHKGSAE